MNIFDLPNKKMKDELCEILAQNINVRIERIISSGQTSDWYNQKETEWVLLVQGNAEIEYAQGEKILLQKGDTLLIPPHVQHKVTYTSAKPPCIWICVFY